MSRVFKSVLLMLCLFEIPVFASSASALSLQWFGRGSNLETASASSCTLLVVSDSPTVPLPGDWRLVWIGTSEAASPLTISGLSSDPEYADACETRRATSAAGIAARVDTVIHCSTGANRRSVARYLVMFAGDARAKIRLFPPDSSFSTLGSENREVTINGGIDDPYPPVAITARGVTQPGQVTVEVSGFGLAAVNRAVLASEERSGATLDFAVEEHGDSYVSLRATLSQAPERGTLELHDATGMTAALAFEPSAMLSAESMAHDHFLVCFAPGAALAPPGKSSGSMQEFSFVPTSLGDALASAGVTGLERVFPWFQASDVDATNSLGEPVRLTDLSTVYVAHVANGRDALAALQAVGEHEGVAYAEPDRVLTANFPNDPLYPSEWGFENTGQQVCERAVVPGFDVRAQGAWSRSLGAPDVSIAILDTGIDNTHLELSDHTILDASFVPYTSSSFDDDPLRHGTAVAGLAAAAIDNGEGIAGLAPLNTVHAIKVLDSGGFGYLSQIAQGVDWARSHGYAIITMSLSTDTHYGFSLPIDSLITLNAACLNAYMSGALVVASSGNLYARQVIDIVDQPWPAFPVAFSRRVLGVGAITAFTLFGGARRWSDLELFPGFCNSSFYYNCRGSNYWDPFYTSGVERFVDLVAPGGRFIATTAQGPNSYKDLSACTILNSSPVSTTTAFGGTSAAAPLVAGAAALLTASFGLPLAGDEIEHVLEVTARRQGLPLSEPPPDRRYGWGLVQPDSAIRYLASPRALTRGELSGSSLPVFDSTLTNCTFRNVKGVSSGGTTCWRYRLRGTTAFPFYTSTPDLWIRGSSSLGTNDTTVYDSFLVVPSGQVLSVSQNTASLETSLFRIPGYGWLPTDPAHAEIAWTAVGPTNVVGIADSPKRGVFALHAAPNPVLASVRIDLELPGRGLTTVSVLDLSGRIVSWLHAGALEGGPHSIRWDGRDSQGHSCPAGVYFVRAEHQGFGLTQKLVLLQGGAR